MVEAFAARLRHPREGVVILTVVVALFMAAHWRPLMFPTIVLLIAVLVAPRLTVRPSVFWFVAVIWLAVLLLLPEHMEDHVWLFVAWLFAVAMSLRGGPDQVQARVTWHARILVGVTFTAAVLWKLYFGTFLTGAALWVFMIVDSRFSPMARVLGVDQEVIARQREGLSALLSGDLQTLSLEVSTRATVGILALAILTLIVEAAIAISFLAPDSSRLTALRLPALTTFAVTTYSVVPVLPFASLLAVLGMAAAGWSRQTLWVFPVFVIPALLRFLVITG